MLMEILKKKELYIFVGFFVASLVFVISIVSAMFGIIELQILDSISSFNKSVNQIQIYLSSKLAFATILFPIVIVISRMIHKKEELFNHSLKNLFLYLALLAMSITGVISLAALVSNFFGGDLTLQFFVKILSLIIFLGLTSTVVYCEIKRMRENLLKYSFFSILAISLVTIIWGVILVDPPSQREIRIDTENARNVFEIAGAVQNYNEDFSRFPTSIEELAEHSGHLPIKDVTTGQEYEFDFLPYAAGVEICANFKRDGVHRDRGDFRHYNDLNKYNAGRSCVKVDKVGKVLTWE